MGGTAEIEIRKGYPVLDNDVRLTGTLKQHASDYLGMDKIVDLDIRMTAEDFSYFSQKYPSCLFRLGVSGKDEKASALHTPTFDIDENSIKVSIGLLSWLAISLLKK